MEPVTAVVIVIVVVVVVGLAHDAWRRALLDRAAARQHHVSEVTTALHAAEKRLEKLEKASREHDAALARSVTRR